MRPAIARAAPAIPSGRSRAGGGGDSPPERSAGPTGSMWGGQRGWPNTRVSAESATLSARRGQDENCARGPGSMDQGLERDQRAAYDADRQSLQECDPEAGSGEPARNEPVEADQA
jgi:hypothetical protein